MNASQLCNISPLPGKEMAISRIVFYFPSWAHFLIPMLKLTIGSTESYWATVRWTGDLLSMLNCTKKEDIW